MFLLIFMRKIKINAKSLIYISPNIIGEKKVNTIKNPLVLNYLFDGSTIKGYNFSKVIYLPNNIGDMRIQSYGLFCCINHLSILFLNRTILNKNLI
jgi:hypothetical protein